MHVGTDRERSPEIALIGCSLVPPLRALSLQPTQGPRPELKNSALRAEIVSP